uniref:Paired domain-containing protein n=1 Tax=Globodera pallida TaxID=36090 RepID=A0A183BXY5_GLOPA
MLIVDKNNNDDKLIISADWCVKFAGGGTEHFRTLLTAICCDLIVVRMQQPALKNGTDADGKLHFNPPASSSSCCFSSSSGTAFSSTATGLPALPFWLLPYPFAPLPSPITPQLQYHLSNQWMPSATAAPALPPPTVAGGNLLNALNANGKSIEAPVPTPSSSYSYPSSSFPSFSHPPAGISTPNEPPFVDRIGESARNRFGRPYISGRPLLLCDRQKIIKMYREGRRKIAIAREIGVTHSCVSKVIRRFEETGMLESKNSRTASCACPGDADGHDPRICRHARFVHLSASSSSTQLPSYEINKMPIRQQIIQHNLPKKFSIEWILSEHRPS